jgi:hypothetical protein
MQETVSAQIAETSINSYPNAMRHTEAKAFLFAPEKIIVKTHRFEKISTGALSRFCFFQLGAGVRHSFVLISPINRFTTGMVG